MDCTGGTVAPARARTQFLATSEEATSAVNGCRPDGHATAPAELTSPQSRAKVTANRSAKGSGPSGPRHGNLPAKALLSMIEKSPAVTGLRSHARLAVGFFWLLPRPSSPVHLRMLDIACRERALSDLHQIPQEIRRHRQFGERQSTGSDLLDRTADARSFGMGREPVLCGLPAGLTVCKHIGD